MSDNDKILEDILQNSGSDTAGDDTVLRKKARKKQKRNIIIASSATLMVASVVGAGVFLNLNPFGGKQHTGEEIDTTSYEEPQNTGGVDGDFSGVEEFWAKDGKYFPVEMDDWEKKPIAETDAPNKDRDSILNTVLNSSSDLHSASSTLPSEASGFTSNQDEAVLDDGLPNPQYSYWTAELFQVEAHSSIERLINPVYGDWERFQYSAFDAGRKFDPSIFNDIFTQRFIEENSGKQPREYLPVFADWEANDYGESRLLGNGGPRWFGKIENSTTDFIYDDKKGAYTAKFKGNVVFTAWTKDEKKLTRKGTLELTFVPNDDSSPNSPYRVLIDQARLSME